jgi:hypothetical protein
MKKQENKEILDFSNASAIKSVDHVFYEFNYASGQYRFVTPTVDKLLGFNINELNRIGFNKHVVKSLKKTK